MKNSVLNLLVFTCFLVVGYTFSVRFYQNGAPILPASSADVTSDIKNTIATMDNGQRNILLIYTSSMSSQNAHLEGIWLASYLPSDTTIQLLPIYPAGEETSSDFGQQLGQTFDLTRQKGGMGLDPSFATVLRKNNYWWSGYIIFDQNSLEELNNIFGENGQDGEENSKYLVLDSPPAVMDDPLGAYSAQVSTLHSLCNKLSTIEKNPEMPQLINLVGSKILTDLDTNLLQTEIELLNTNRHQPACRFPSLDVSRIVP